jgi:hypothetical protein
VLRVCLVNYAIACVCLYGTYMLASISYLLATIRGLSLLVTHSLSLIREWMVDGCRWQHLHIEAKQPTALHQLQGSKLATEGGLENWVHGYSALQEVLGALIVSRVPHLRTDLQELVFAHAMHNVV